MQRAYLAALANIRHLVPLHRLPLSPHMECNGLPTLLDSLQAAQHVLETFLRASTDYPTRRLLNRFGNRLIKIIAELSKIDPA